MSEIRIQADFDISASHLYSAFTNETMLNSWLAEGSRNDVRVNGFYHLYWNAGAIAAGIYKAVEPDKRLVFSWFASGDAGETAVDVTFEGDGDSTKLTLVHGGFGDGAAADANRSRWESALENLRYFLNTGLDRRIMLRPMLGIHPGGLDEARRESHGLQHVESGVFLTNVVEGGGAAASGLRAHDVIVGLEGETIRDFYDMSRVIARHQAGDTIPAEFWRGKDKLSVALTFGQRPIPQLPQTHDALVATTRERIEAIKGELDDILSGLPEPVMAFKPSANEWSLNEQLAHLIVAERANSYYYWMIVGGDGAYPYANNDAVQLALGACGFETGAALLEEVKRTLDENVAVVAALPEPVAGNRALFLMMGNIASFAGDHVRTHYPQMRETLEKAQAAVPA